MSPRSRPPADLFPERVGAYELLAPIASGGMATVYLARRKGVQGFERQVALKLTHAHLRGEHGFVHEVIEEAKLAARIRHPNVAQVIDVGDDPNGVFFVMEYVEGDSLAGLMRAECSNGRRVPPSIALRILCDALAGLHAAHELRGADGAPAHLVHRDVSPQNVLVGIDGASRLIDFGIAKTASRGALTKSGIIKGKFGYMAPEHLRGQPLDRRADVWSAGIVAWELLAGSRLHSGEEAMIILRTLSEEPTSLRNVCPELPAALADAVASALAIDREKRCPTADELRRRIVESVAGQVAIADIATVAHYVTKTVGPKLEQQQRGAASAAARRHDAASPRTPATPVLETAPMVVVRPDPDAASPRRWGLRIAGGSALVLALLLTLGARRFGGPPEAARAAVEPPPVPAEAPADKSIEPKPAEPTTDDGPASASAVVPSPSASPTFDLSVSANAKIFRIMANGIATSISPPASAVTVPLAGVVPGTDVQVQAFATDGRVGRQIVKAGAHSVTFAFAAPRARAAPASPPTTTGSPPPKDPLKGKLQENPYSE